jgi:broad specificity phosphatase PhoE
MNLRRLQTIRHGLTTANLARVCGSPDDLLADEGERQATEARARLADAELGTVISSPMPRAVATARIVSGLSPELIHIDEDCRERDFGALSGLTHQEAVARFPEVEYLEIKGVQYSMNPPGGETLAELRERAGRFFASLRESSGAPGVTVFSHGNFLQQLRAVIFAVSAETALELPLEGIMNLSMMRFDFSEGGDLVEHSITQLSSNDGVRGLY